MTPQEASDRCQQIYDEISGGQPLTKHSQLVEVVTQLIQEMGGTVLPCVEPPRNEIGFVWFTHIDGQEVCSNPGMSGTHCTPDELNRDYNMKIAMDLCQTSVVN